MSAWIMAHPWMFFFLVCLGIVAVDNIVLNIAKVVDRYLTGKRTEQQHDIRDEPKGDGDGRPVE